MRHIKKITLLTLLSLNIGSSPAQGMSYLSNAWNAAKSIRFSTLTSPRSLLGRTSIFQSVDNDASRSFNNTSSVISSYAHNEAGSFSHYNLVGHLIPIALYSLRNPMCKLLSQLTRNKLSPDFFNKLITATTAPIALAVHAYCLYHMISTIPLWDLAHMWNAWLLYRNIKLLMKDTAALLSINSLPVPPEPTHGDWHNILNNVLIGLYRPINTLYNPNFIAIIMNGLSYSVTSNYYRSVGIHSGYAAIKDKINQGIRKFKRFFSAPPIRQDVRIDSLGENATCGICLENFAGDEAGSRLACNHHFHTDCIDPWLDNNALHPTCPTCRAPAPDNTITPITFR